MSYKTEADAERALSNVMNAIARHGGESSFPQVYHDGAEWHYKVEAWSGGRWTAFFSNTVTTAISGIGGQVAYACTRRAGYRSLERN